MIELRRTGERRYLDRPGRKLWHTFHARRGLPEGFGALLQLDEVWRPSGVTSSQLRCSESEMLTYVRDGSMAYRDSTGRSGVIAAGELHAITAGDELRRSESNVSATEPAHMFQFWLQPPLHGLEPGCEQKRFSRTERRGKLGVLASPDGRLGSLKVRTDVVLYSAMLSRGQHVVHELMEGRSAWLHVVEGEVMMGDAILSTGDGAGITDARSVSLTAQGEAEILLLDLEDPAASRGPSN